jgi:ABC-2 type transport system ATP-binding protein
MKRSDAKRRGAKLLEAFELADAGERVLKTYSGGMRRRLDLAASLVARPPVLFLDEPTTGLDLTSRQRMWTVIRTLVSEGTTVLLSTQYLDEADSLADRIVLFDHGRVIAEGTPAELKGSTGSQLVEVTLAAPHAGAAAALAELGTGAVNVSGGGLRLTVPVRNEPGLAVAALRSLDAVGAQVEDIAVHRPTLDDVFGILTGATGPDGAPDTGDAGEGGDAGEAAAEFEEVLL